MLIVSTYRVVLHPSYIQKVFSFIIFIKERYSFTILSENSRAPGGVSWAELKSDEHMSSDWQQNRHLMPFTICCFESWLGTFIAGTAPSFSIKRCANAALNWAWLIKRWSTNTFAKLHCCPEKTNCIHCSRNAGFFGKLNKVIFPSQPTTHFFRDILPERVPCSAAEWSALMGGLLLSLRSMCSRARFFGRNAHTRSSTLHYVRKSNDRKILSKTCKQPGVFGTEILGYTSKSFF